MSFQVGDVVDHKPSETRGVVLRINPKYAYVRFLKPIDELASDETLHSVFVTDLEKIGSVSLAGIA